MNKLIELFNSRAITKIEYDLVENNEFCFLLRKNNNTFFSVLLYNPHNKRLFLRNEFSSEYNKINNVQNSEFISFLENKFEIKIESIDNSSSNGMHR